MIVMQEFEVYPDPEGGYAVEPCGLAGATEGDTYEEAVEMAVDWLRVHALAALERGAEFEGGGLGHEPSHGGTIVTVATNVELSDIPAVTAAEAAEMLGVSTARVAQLRHDGSKIAFHAAPPVTFMITDCILPRPRPNGNNLLIKSRARLEKRRIGCYTIYL